jgi:hypothetical protein
MPECANGEQYLWQFLDTKDDLMVVDSFVKANSVINISDSGTDYYRPLFWYSDDSKSQYENKFGIVHSDCYKKYGFKRTGCCCCPYGRELFEELRITETFEPELYKAVCNVFGESYEYTRKYRAFAKAMKREQLEEFTGQMNIFDYEVGE